MERRAINDPSIFTLPAKASPLEQHKVDKVMHRVLGLLEQCGVRLDRAEEEGGEPRAAHPRRRALRKLISDALDQRECDDKYTRFLKQ
mmetsp:Transcript_3495/g.5960  ORF Transcript_3495/g.5960 Transcript_3495/m.5960 type:complete len:88 (+) Transcript_3495:1110-1373(+)